MLSNIYLSVELVKTNIFHVNITGGLCIFPKVGEGVTQFDFG